MFGKGLRLYKREKLCSVSDIERLFSARIPSGGAQGSVDVGMQLCYPLRMVYAVTDSHPGVPVKFLVSVPKRRLRHAVDRVLMRRRVREAYRICRGDIDRQAPGAESVDVAFIYVADRVVSFHKVLRAMTRLTAALKERLHNEDSDTVAEKTV